MFRKRIGGGIKYIVAGLGNPGKKYTFTRHNAGFLALDFIAKTRNFKINTIKFKSLTGRCDYFIGEPCGVLFLKPQTYMNRSGEAVAEAARFYKVPVENIILIFDDVSLPAGKIRIRRSGSHGGQKGAESVIDHLQSDNFPRIKIGVGEKPHPDYELADWVLSELSGEEKKIVFDTFVRVDAALTEIIETGSTESAMNKYN